MKFQVREGDWWPPPVQLDKAYVCTATQQHVFREAVQPVLEELCEYLFQLAAGVHACI
jgi:hypothetical protein